MLPRSLLPLPGPGCPWVGKPFTANGLGPRKLVLGDAAVWADGHSRPVPEKTDDTLAVDVEEVFRFGLSGLRMVKDSVDNFRPERTKLMVMTYSVSERRPLNVVLGMKWNKASHILALLRAILASCIVLTRGNNTNKARRLSNMRYVYWLTTIGERTG